MLLTGAHDVFQAMDELPSLLLRSNALPPDGSSTPGRAVDL
jgi:hypothetical protein